MTRPLVVLSPGARSLPLVLALSRTNELDVVDVVDERAAAFFALGHARATGEAAVVVATSGTAPAHWYPAVLEASAAELPLVCLSADRPTELHHCGAAQTTDQLGLFGRNVRFFADLGDPQSDPRWLAGVRRTVAQARYRASHPTPGPVHLDFRARKPLEPTGAPDDATALAAQAVVDGLLGRNVARLTPPSAALAEADARRLAVRLAAAERPWVVLGPLAPTIDRARVVAFLERYGAPFFAEATSQLRFGPRPEGLALDALDLVLGGAGRPEPDLLVMIGGTPTSGAIERFVGARPQLPRVVLGVRGWTDPWGTAEEIVPGEPSSILAAITAALGARTSPPDLDRLRALDARAWEIVERDLAGPSLAEGHVAAAVVRALPVGGALLVGNSLPIRLVDRFARGGGASLRVLSQRGVNGIDGLVSASLGSARALGVPFVALLGDLTTLHDVGALAAAPRTGPPIVLVALVNGGGRIFEQLPVASRADLAYAMPHVLTEHGASLAAAAVALGARGERVANGTELHNALRAGLEREGTTVLEVRVPPHDAAQREVRLRAAMADVT